MPLSGVSFTAQPDGLGVASPAQNSPAKGMTKRPREVAFVCVHSDCLPQAGGYVEVGRYSIDSTPMALPDAATMHVSEQPSILQACMRLHHRYRTTVLSQHGKILPVTRCMRVVACFIRQSCCWSYM